MASITYAGWSYEWYVGELPLAGRVLSMLCSVDDVEKLARDWVLESREMAMKLEKNINRYGSITV
jgi:hypothetical protein